MSCTKYICLLTSSLLLGTATAGTAEKISDLEKQLNQCREEYKAQVARTNEEIKDLKAKAPSNLNSIYAEKQKQLKQKANSCKKIKTQIAEQKSILATEIEFEKQSEVIKQAQSIKKAGPRFRCLQLRQNWQEFSACAKSLGLEPTIGVTKSNNTAFFAKDIAAIIDESNHVSEIIITGAAFWNADEINNSFILAFVKQYDVENFLPEQGLFGTTYYKGTVNNGKITINPTTWPIPGHIAITYTESRSGYSF